MAPTDALHTLAERRYLELMLLSGGDEGSGVPPLTRLALEFEADEDAPAVGLEVLAAWCEAERWDQAYNAMTVTDGPLLDCLRSDVRLAAAVDDAASARAVWVMSNTLAKAATATLGDVQKHRLAYQTLTETEGRLLGLEGELKRTVGLTPVPIYRARQEELLARLTAQYGALGTQYEVLVYRLAAAEVRLEQLEAGGIAEGREYQDCTRLVIELTNQLQKFTETQKTEQVVKKQNEAMLGLLTVLEVRIAPEYPTLWARVLGEIAELIKGGGPLALPSPLPNGAAA